MQQQKRRAGGWCVPEERSCGDVATKKVSTLQISIEVVITNYLLALFVNKVFLFILTYLNFFILLTQVHMVKLVCSLCFNDYFPLKMGVD